MTDRWYYRKAHARRLSTSRRVSVRGGWALRGDRGSKKSISFKQACPVCGALIISVGVLRGGWVHFGSGNGLTRVKHPCLRLG